VSHRSDDKSYQNISEASFSYREEEKLEEDTYKDIYERFCFQVSFLQFFSSFFVYPFLCLAFSSMAKYFRIF